MQPLETTCQCIVETAGFRSGISLLHFSLSYDAPTTPMMIEAGSDINSSEDYILKPVRYSSNSLQYRRLHVYIEHVRCVPAISKPRKRQFVVHQATQENLVI